MAIVSQEKRGDRWEAVVDAEHQLLAALEKYAEAVEVEAIQGDLEKAEAVQLGCTRSLGVAVAFATSRTLGAALADGLDIGRHEVRRLVMGPFLHGLDHAVGRITDKAPAFAAAFVADDSFKTLRDIVRQLDEDDDVVAFFDV